MITFEVGPHHFANAHLRVGQLPEEEVAEPILARRANGEVGIREPRREEGARENIEGQGQVLKSVFTRTEVVG